MRRRTLLGSVLALLAAAPKAIFAAESTDDSLDSEFLRSIREQQQQTLQELERVRSEQELAEQEVVRTQRVQAAADAELKQVQDQLFAKIEEINDTQFQIDRLQVEIHRLTQDTAREEAILADEQEIVSGRLRALYKLSRISPLEVILTASSFTDALNRITIFRRILDDDIRHVRATQERKAELDARRATLVEKQAEIAALKRQRESQQAQLEDLKAQRKSLLDEAAQDANNARWTNASLQNEKALLETEQAALAAQEEAEKRRLREGGIKLPEWAPADWLRPAGGYISAGFGVRTWLQASHSGIDYATARFSRVLASQDGRVTKVGYAIDGNRWSSYGMMVKVRHSWNETSLYAHLDDSRELPVKEGDTVFKGQTLGFVGMTGFTSGPHLHFEIRLDNVPKNPNNWLR